jgi:hypothetical protein
MPGAVTTINGIIKYRANSKPKPVAKLQAFITVENQADHRQGFFDLRGNEVMLDPGESRSVTVPLHSAYRMQRFQLVSKLKVLELTQLPENG